MELIKRIALLKMYYNRCAQYVTIVNFGILVTANLKLWSVPYKYYPPILILGLFGMLCVGWLDTKLKFFREEQGHIANQNPVLIEIKQDIKKILEK